MNEEEMSEEEKLELQKYLNYGNPVPEEKHNVHTFLDKVNKADDTTKTGYLMEDEIGTPKYPTRAFKVAALYSKSIMDNDELSEYFLRKSEILTSTSLSRQGFLVKAAITQKKELADMTPLKKENKSWFKKKDDNPTGGI